MYIYIYVHLYLSLSLYLYLSLSLYIYIYIHIKPTSFWGGGRLSNSPPTVADRMTGYECVAQSYISKGI